MKTGRENVAFLEVNFLLIEEEKFTLRTTVEHVSHIITHRVFHLGLEL
jgi:hypothetical protein